MKKLLLLVLLCSLVISGCSVSSSKEMKTNTKSSYPQTLVDQLGREVTIEKEPKRIVSGYYISTSLLIALDLKDETVGIESKPEKRPIYSMAAPEFLELPNVGTMKEFNIEATLALEPDLVLLPIKLKDSIDVLEELGITVLAINPESDELLHETIALVAKATNRIELGDNLLNKIKTFNEKLKTLLSDVDQKSVYLGGNSELLSTAGSKMYQNTLITLANGKNVASDLSDAYWANISYEQLLAWNPDVILIASDAVYSKEDLLNDTNLQDIKAVKNKAIASIPGNLEAWDSPVPSSVLGSLWIASELYPEKYSKEEFGQDVRDFYSTFYQIEASVNE